MDLRRVINGSFDVHQAGCQGSMRPRGIGHGRTIDGNGRRGRLGPLWATVRETRRRVERRGHGRLPEPSARGADRQRVNTATQGREVGVDGPKTIKGRKRPLLVETRGLTLAVVVTPAHPDDRQG